MRLAIDSLRLRVVRKRSLFWGDDPRAIARKALARVARLLPQAVEELGRLEDLEVVEPVSVRIHLARRHVRDALAGEGEAARRFDDCVREAVRAAVARARRESPVRTAANPTSRATGAGLRPVLGDLLALHAEGALGERLRALDVGMLESFHRVLLLDPPPSAGSTEGSEGVAVAVEAFLTAVAAGVRATSTPRDRRVRLIERLTAVIALAAQEGIAPFHPAVRRVFDQLLPLDGVPIASAKEATADVADSTSRGSSTVNASASRSSTEGDTGRGPRRDAQARPLGAVERIVDAHGPRADWQSAPALAVVVLAELHRAGLVARIAARLQAALRPGDLGLWCAAVALKCGRAVPSGRFHSALTWDAAAPLAGLDALRAESITSLASDRRADWSGAAIGLARELALAESGPWHRSASDAVVALGVGAHPRLVWIGTEEAAGRVTSDATVDDTLSDSIDALARRPATGPGAPVAFDQHVGGIVGWALFDVASALWPDEAPSVPLVFERLGSLDARVRLGEDALEVRVPYGPRHSHLLRAGLLDDVRSAAWLGGRPIRIRGG